MLDHTATAPAGWGTPADRPAGASARPASAIPRDVMGAGPVVVAAADGPGSDAALLLARRLAGALASDVQVVVAAEPPLVLDPYMGPMAYPLGNAPWLRECRERLDRQLARTGLESTGWPVDVVVGEPARRIAAFVNAGDARIVLLGRERHLAIPGRYGSRLALRLLRQTDAPVLSVAPSLAHLPRRVVAGVDFSPYSVHAVRVALAIAAPDAVVHLVWVNPRVPGARSIAELLDFAPDLDATLPDAWRRLLADVGDTGGRQIETVTITGDPATALAAYAAEARADLVVAGTHGRGFVGRLMLGSVAETLLQHAECSVLCVPGSALARAEHRRRALDALRTECVPAAQWGATLAALTSAYAGRRCTVEVHHAESGAQHLVDGLPFAGVSHDARDGRITLTFGAADAAAGSIRDLVLTHVVPDVTAVDTWSDADGRVVALRLAERDGQTLVTFT